MSTEPAAGSPSRSRSSTRRCATARSSRASRSPSRTSSASPSSSTGSACAGSRAATRRPTPRTPSSSRARPTELKLSTRPSWWRSGRPAARTGKVDDDPTLRGLVEAGARHGVHRGQVLGLPRHRGAADHARRGRGDGGRLGAVPQGRGPARVLRRRALLRRLQAPTPSSRCACSRPRPWQRRRLPGAVRHQRRLAAPRRRSGSTARSPRYFGADVQLGIHTQNDSGCAVANSVAAVLRRRHAGAGHRSTATASAPATPTS